MKILNLVLVVVACLTGCETPRQTRAGADTRIHQADEMAVKAALPGIPAGAGTTAVHDGIWVGGRSILNPNGDPLPVRAEAPGAVVLNSAGAFLELKEIAAEITAQTGVKLEIEDTVNGAAPAPAQQMATGMALAWNGPLSGLLDGVAIYFGMQWEYRGGRLRLYRNEIRTFTLAALPSSSTLKAGVNTSHTTGGAGNAATAGASGGVGGGAMGASGSMLQDISNVTTIKLWDDVRDTIQSMLPSGAKLSMSPATGTVTVVAPPVAMRRVASFIEQQNERITRQVTVTVKVLRVDVNDNFDLGIDLNLAFQRLAGDYAVNLAGPGPLSATAGKAAAYSVQSTKNLDGGKAQVTSNAVLDALQVMGKVTLVTETSVTTMNGQAAPVSVAEERNYVASVATTAGVSLTGATQTQLTPATLVTGFNMQVLPRILENGDVLLQYGLSLSDLQALDEFSSGGSTVQLPDVKVRSFLQQAILRSGELLVLAGYQSTSDSTDDRGLPGVGPSPLGGSVSTVHARSVIVIMMTPEILGRPVLRGAS